MFRFRVIYRRQCTPQHSALLLTHVVGAMSQVNGEGSFSVPGLRNRGTDLLKFTVINYVHHQTHAHAKCGYTVAAEKRLGGEMVK